MSEKPYGIFITKKAKGVFEYFCYGKIIGLRTLKGDDIDYDDSGDEEGNKRSINKKQNKSSNLKRKTSYTTSLSSIL